MSVAYHSPHIEALAERVRRGQPAFTYTPTLSDDDGVRVMAGVYEIAPSRRRRGASRLSLKLAGLWLISALTIFGSLVFLYGAVLWVVGEIAETWGRA